MRYTGFVTGGANIRETYEAQRRLDHLREVQAQVYENTYYSLHPRDRERVDVYQHPDVRAARATTASQAALTADLQQQVGGIVYRVPVANLERLTERVAQIQRRAAKLAVGEIALTLTEERDWIEQEDGAVEVTYVIVDGEAPRLEGWTFLATLDHVSEEQTVIRRIPAETYMMRRGRADGEGVNEAQAQAAIEAVDLDRYRNAPPRCDHCGFDRRRRDTYIVVHDSGETRQVGSDCIRDFLGGNDPQRVARLAEWFRTIDEELGEGGEIGGFGGVRRSVSTLTYLTHVAALIREQGYTSRWFRDGGYQERRHGTADAALDNIANYGKAPDRHGPRFIPVTEADEATAQATIAWVQELAERPDPSEFDHNLITYATQTFLPERGEGYVAYAPVARTRAIEREVTQAARAEQAANAEPVPEGRGVVTGAVVSTDVKENEYGTRYVMTVLDDRGFRVWGTIPSKLGPVEQGDRISFTATLERSDRDETFGFFKRPSQATRQPTEALAA